MIKKFFVFLFLLAIFLASSYSLFHKSFFHVHDFTHAARIAEMAKALDDGQFPVRWSENFGYGFGMPLFNFYAPLPYFIGAIFLKLGFDVVASIKILYLLCNLITLYASYLLGKKLFGRYGGLLLAASYSLAPYRAVNLFVRGALSEAFAMAFLPIVILEAINFTKQPKTRYLLILILSLAAIILSHNLTAMMFIPLSALFIFLYLLHEQKIQLLGKFVLSYFLAFGLTAFYSLPAFLEKDSTIINTIFSGYFHYSNHFLYIRQFFTENWQYGGSAWGINDGVSFFLGSGQLLGLLGLGLLIIQAIRKQKDFFKSKWFFLFAIFTSFVVLSLFMSILKSQFLWDRIKILQYIQFPWRFLALAVFFLAILLAASTYLIRNNYYRGLYTFLLIFILFQNAIYFRPEAYLEDQNALYYTDSARIQNQMSEILPDYIPKQMAKQEILRQRSQDLPQVWFEKSPKGNNAELIYATGFEKLALVNLKTADSLNFKVAYFPGWQVEVDGDKYQIKQNPELGNIMIDLPSGEHKVAIYFSENTTARKIGDTLSFLAILVILYNFGPFASPKKDQTN